MARKLNLRIWRGDATDGGLKNVEVEANEGEVVNRRKNMGGCKHTRPSTDWDVERSEAAWLDGFQGTHHEASGQADVEIARCGAHQ